MSQNIRILLENIIKNKLFFILMAVSWGIGIRFTFLYQNSYSITGIIISIISYALYKLCLWRYELCTISYDLNILNAVSDKKFISFQKTLYLSLLIISILTVKN